MSNALPTTPVPAAAILAPHELNLAAPMAEQLRPGRLPAFARIEWLDGTVETFASFWDAWNSVEDRFAIADGNYITVEGETVGRIIDGGTV